MQSHIRKVYACLVVTCHLRFWQNDRGLLRATAVNTVKAPVFDLVVVVSQAAVFREQARPRFLTSYFQPGNQGLECAEHRVPSLGFGLDERYQHM